MPDRKKAIKDLNTARFILASPTIDITPDLRIRIGRAIYEAIDLLQERKAVKPIPNDSFYSCGNCGGHLWVAGQKYCASCGMEVNWG